MDQVPSPTAPATGELSFCQGAERDSRLPFGDGKLKQSMLGESTLDCTPLPFFFFFFSSTLPCPPFCIPCSAFPPAPFPLFLCFLSVPAPLGGTVIVGDLEALRQLLSLTSRVLPKGQ